MLNVRNIMIKSRDDGEIDYEDLRETIRIHRDVPVIFMANIGSTMKGAVDDVQKVRGILDDLAVTNACHSSRSRSPTGSTPVSTAYPSAATSSSAVRCPAASC